MKDFSITVLLALLPLASNAQIGYQVALLNNATGEPRANETVSVDVTIINSEDKIVCTQTQSATTNEFGILSLKVGDDTSFEKADWSKLPFFITATVDGIMLGKTQILNVPVAEYAKRIGSIVPHDILTGKEWENIEEVPTEEYEGGTIIWGHHIVQNGKFTDSTYEWYYKCVEYMDNKTYEESHKYNYYFRDDNVIFVCTCDKKHAFYLKYIPELNGLIQPPGSLIIDFNNFDSIRNTIRSMLYL